MRRRLKGYVALLAALVLLAVAALPALAASERVEAVLEKLAYFQRVNIEPWEGDVQANRQQVQEMLALYEACTADERAEFTEEQEAALAAYFEVLYALDGRDPAEVAALFEPGAGGEASSGASSGTSSAPSPGSSSSSGAVSSESSSSSASSSASPSSASQVSSAAPASSASGAEDSSDGYLASAQPGEGEGGWLALFGNKGLGSVLIILLVVLAAVLLVRFVTALRKTPRPSGAQADEDLRARELFGEGYDPESPDGRLDGGTPPPKNTDKNGKKPEKKPPADPQDKPPAAPMPTFVRPAAPQKPAAPMAQKPAAAPAEKAPVPDEDGGAQAVRTEKKIAILPPGLLQRRTPVAGQGAPARPNREPGAPAAVPPPTIGPNPDRPKSESIAMRSFSGSPPNGRPQKMPFRQGDPDDLDAIDE